MKKQANPECGTQYLAWALVKKSVLGKTKIVDNYFKLRETHNQMKGMNLDQVRNKRHLGEQLGNFKYELNIRKND